MTTGQFIKEERLKQGLTQEELAAKTDTSARTIQRIENGEVSPRAFTLQNIATALKVDFEALNNINKVIVQQNCKKVDIWIPLLHLSGLFTLLIPPLVIWALKRNEIKELGEHARHVINFQLSMLLYIIGCFLLSILVITVFIGMGLVFFSTIIIIINSLKVFNGQRYKYPLAINFLTSQT